VIGKVGTEREMPLVLESLLDAQWFVRAAAARSVEWMLTLNDRPSHAATRQSAAEKLGPCLTDSSWWVRANAARALSRIGDAGVGVLMRHVDNTDRYARDAAIAALAMAPLPAETRLNIKKKIDNALESGAIPRTPPPSIVVAPTVGGAA
jgi:HEAT repeat protein